MSTKKNQPVHFIKVEKDGNLMVNNEAMVILKEIKTPVAVISIAGLARTGKSYILNRIVEKITGDHGFKGFTVGSTIDSCTKGIWMWSLPIEIKQNGGKISIIILDTEGLASLDEEQTHDAKIFTMAILLSCLFVYNSMGSIDQSAIDRLSLVCELTKLISAKNSKKNNKDQDEKELSQFSPFFLWVLRDFILDLKHEGKQITSSQYLELALQQKPEKSNTSEERNKIRKSIQTLFPERDCCTLVRPMSDEKKIRKMSEATENDLRLEFIVQMKELLDLIQNKLKVKEINGSPLNGMMLCELTKSYVQSINSGAIPSISGAWDSVAEIQCHKALENAIEYLEKKVGEIKNVDFNKLKEIFKDIEFSTIEIFSKTAIGDKTEEFKEKLILKIKKEIEKKKKETEKNSEEICQKMMNEISNKFHQNLDKGLYKSVNDFKKDLFQALNQYKNETYGESKFPIYTNFMENDVIGILQKVEMFRDSNYKFMIDKLELEKEKSKKDYENQINQLKEKLESVNKECNKEREKFKILEKDFKTENSNRERQSKEKTQEVFSTPPKSDKKNVNEYLTPKRDTPKRKDVSRLSVQVIKSNLKELGVEVDPKVTKIDLETIYNEVYDEIEEEERELERISKRLSKSGFQE